MLHNHFILSGKVALAARPLAQPDNSNLTYGSQHSLFQAHMRDVYRAFYYDNVTLNPAGKPG